jgi:putative AlgH/UPF0301 family transcriptional regulator
MLNKGIAGKRLPQQARNFAVACLSVLRHREQDGLTSPEAGAIFNEIKIAQLGRVKGILQQSHPESAHELGEGDPVAQVSQTKRLSALGSAVEPRRGFVLHSTVDMLRAIAQGTGPRRALLALGYAGWSAGQLDQEIQSNSWLSVDPDDALLFDADLDTKWHRAIAKLGVDITMLSSEAGHA